MNIERTFNNVITTSIKNSLMDTNMIDQGTFALIMRVTNGTSRIGMKTVILNVCVVVCRTTELIKLLKTAPEW